VGALLFGLWWCQGLLLYLPNFSDRKGEKRKVQYNDPGYRSPADRGLQFTDSVVTTRDGVDIHCWWLPQSEVKAAPTVIFFHGNAGSKFLCLSASLPVCCSRRARMLCCVGVVWCVVSSAVLIVRCI
jgi:hypothetical protein